MSTQTVALDIMGGDIGPSETVPAAVQALSLLPQLNLVLVGDQHLIAPLLQQHGLLNHPRVRLVHASQVVGMGEKPIVALRTLKDSSMRVVLNLVKAGEADACVSAGNTGALMATARFVLKTIPGIDRPAIAKLLPTMKGESCVLDLGANVDCTPEQLLQFGIMGATLIEGVTGRNNPTVGLLNIGSEEIKGNDTVKQAAELLRNSSLNFYGNVEGNDIYLGTVDVIVTDGFTGNVALKTSEGLAHMVGALLKQEFGRNLFTRLSALAALPVLKHFKKRLDSRRYNGASLVGLRGIVVKSHGGTDSLGFGYAIEEAVAEVRGNVTGHIQEQVSRRLAALEPGDATLSS